MNEKEIVIYVHFGGLGDHLFHSFLPRALKQNNLADKVYLSNQCVFRNRQTFDLVWKNNPFLDGVVDKNPTTILTSKSKIDKVTNHIAYSYGLGDFDYEIMPELYNFKSDINSISKGMNCLDLNYISFVGAFTIFDKFYLFIKYWDYTIVNPSFIFSLLSRKKVFTTSLMDYVSLVNNCENFVCLASGGATLSAALHKKATVYYAYGQPTIFHHTTNQNIMLGGSSFFRKMLSRILFKINEFRISRSNKR